MEFKNIIAKMRANGLDTEADALEEKNKNFLAAAIKSGVAAILARNQSHGFSKKLKKLFTKKK